MNFKIVSDSSADLLALDGVPFKSVPLTVVTSEREYVDSPELDTTAMLSELKKYKGRSGSSCPNPNAFLTAFGDAECIFCVTITSNLSGSYNSAVTAAKAYTEAHPARRVHVVDTLSTGPESALIIERLRDLILESGDFDTVKLGIEEYCKSTHLLFSLESIHNLASNGRVSPLVAKLSGILGIRVVGRASDHGTLEVIEKSRGERGALRDLLKNMKATGYSGGRLKIHHADNPGAADILRQSILAQFPDAEVQVAGARGLCCFYAEAGGLLVGFEA